MILCDPVKSLDDRILRSMGLGMKEQVMENN